MATCPCGCGVHESSRPKAPRVAVFIDGQNLFKQAQRCYGDLVAPYENYDPIALSQSLAGQTSGGVLQCVHFYSGRPWGWGGHAGEANLGRFLERKIRHYTSAATGLFFPELKNLAYRPPEKTGGRPIGREKGVDVALAIAIVMGAVEQSFDVAVILSQDKDLNDIPRAVAKVRDRLSRWLHVESAFPVPPSAAPSNGSVSKTGIRDTRWLFITQKMYDASRDSQDFRDRFKTAEVVPFPGDFEYVAHVRTTECRPIIGARRQLGIRATFPPCPSCGEPVFWCRYKKFLTD